MREKIAIKSLDLSYQTISDLLSVRGYLPINNFSSEQPQYRDIVESQFLQIKISQQTTFVNMESSCRTSANSDNSQIIRFMLNYAKLPSLQSH